MTGLKRAIRKATVTYQSQVERLVKEGLLDLRHRWWAGSHNVALKKQAAKEAKEAAKEAAKKQAATPAAAHAPPPRIQTAQDLAEQQKTDQQERNAKLSKLNKNRESNRKTYLRMRKAQFGLDYFNQWWNAVFKETLGDVLSEEEQVWRKRENPLYASDASLAREAIKDSKGKDQSLLPTEGVPHETSVAVVERDEPFDELFDDDDRSLFEDDEM
jgi:hypothetical protein